MERNEFLEAEITALKRKMRNDIVEAENAALRTRLEEEKMVKEKMTKTCKDLKFFWDNGMIDWSKAPPNLFLPE